MRPLLLLALSSCVVAERPSDKQTDSAEDACTPLTWYGDGDGDGFGAADFVTEACEMPARYVDNADDCDDTDPAVSPAGSELCNDLDDDCDGTADEDATDALTWWGDADGDGFAGDETSTTACEAPAGYHAESLDCADGDPAVSPAAVEACNGTDDDCDGETDEADASDVLTWYADDDGDTYGDEDVTTEACEPPPGYVADHDDCDDARADAHIGADETCNALDDDCDGTPDDNPTDPSTWYFDADGDGYGRATTTLAACEQPPSYVAEGTDCDDVDADRHPDAPETCDTVDSDCDGEVAEDDSVDALTWYADDDADGFGDAADTTTACSLPDGFTADATDCDDTLSTTFPDSTEYCNGSDDDCDGNVDEDGAADGTAWYTDADGDGYGDPDTVILSCGTVADAVENGEDCDDAEPDALPGGTEVCGDDIDQDCSGVADDDCGPVGKLTTEDANSVVTGRREYAQYGRQFLSADLYGADGEPDLIAADEYYVQVLGGPVTASTMPHDNYFEYPSKIGGVMAAGDADGDGAEDLLLSVDGTSDRVALIAGPAGGSSYLADYDVLGISLSATDLTMGEFDGDTGEELLLLTTDYYVRAFEGTLTGTVTKDEARDIYYCGAGCAHVGTGDFDGDGLDEVFMEAATVYMYDASTESMLKSWTTSSSYNRQLILDADVDGDGLVDLFAPAADGKAALVLAGSAAGVLDSVAEATFTSTDSGYYTSPNAAGDLDGDGHGDLALAYNGKVALFYGPVSGALDADSDADATITSDEPMLARFVDVLGGGLPALGIGVPLDETGGTATSISVGDPNGSIFLFDGGG